VYAAKPLPRPPAVNPNTSGDSVGAGGASEHRERRLTPERVLHAALGLVDDQGLDALTMRRLAQQLGCNPMSLYRYFPNRAALLDGLVEVVLEQLPSARPGLDQGWQGQLRDGGHQFRKLALAHPSMAVLFITQPLSTPLALRPRGTLKLLEHLLALLAHAGLTVDDSVRVARAYVGCLYGHVLTELQTLATDPDQPDPLRRLGIHKLPATQFPHIRSAAPQLAAFDGATELDLTLDALFDGLTTQLNGPSDSGGAV